ncbi:MAG: 2-dehydropantoate 2-reductase [Pseudomonadota bacterium]
MKPRIAVLGGGAIGSSVAADLARIGEDVTLVDQWPAHVEAINANGLRVVMSDDDFTVRLPALHLCDLAAARETYDLVLLAAKGYDTRWMTELIQPYLAEGGMMVGLQNGMGDEDIASIVGRERTLGCVVELSAEVFSPGLVQRNTTRATTWLGFGELDGRTSERLLWLQQLMGCTASVSITGNVSGAKWTKLVNSSMILSVFGMLGLQSWQATDRPEVFRLCIQVGRETVAVGAAAGLRLEPIFGFTSEQFHGSTDETIETLLRAVLGHLGPNARKARGVVLQDYAKGRRTEVQALTGVVVGKGRALGVPTPANAAVLEVNRRIDAGLLQPDPSNVALAEALIAAATDAGGAGA